MTEASKKGRRGFASMSPEKQREIASLGGKTAHARGTAYKWTSEKAQAAGRKGGTISRKYRANPLPQIQTEEQVARLRLAQAAYDRHFEKEEHDG